MRVVALISGGKDSCYNMMQCVSAGHTIVALANLRPPAHAVSDELDSYMYQTVGHQAVDLLAEAMDLPLYRHTIKGSSLHTGREYSPTEGDEVEDLYQLLKLVQEEVCVEAVSVGAILSDYQRIRVENVCARLELQPLAYLWRRDQAELLREIISSGLDARLIKVAAIGLDPERHLGKSLAEMEPYLHELSEKYGVHICGEGGEYETFTVDCPLFKKKIVIDSAETVIHSADAFAPVGFLRLTHMHTEDKTEGLGALPLSRCPCQNTIDKMTEELEYADKSPDVQRGCPSNAERGCQPEQGRLPSHSSRSPAGFQWISGLTAPPSEHAHVQGQSRHIFTLLQRRLQERGWRMEHVLLVHLYVRDMENFSLINSLYRSFFTLDPPARYITGPSLVHHWSITGPSLVHHWSITGPSLVHHWSITGASLVHHWYITGPSLVHHWCITGPSLVHHWSITGASLVHHWSITGASLVHHWSITGPSLVHHWSITGA
ncbi:diphthine--ammonia ligase [Pimephales promelas]|nr:diphthine--ammonia ligase [Pimephales promelas]